MVRRQVLEQRARRDLRLAGSREVSWYREKRRDSHLPRVINLVGISPRRVEIARVWHVRPVFSSHLERAVGGAVLMANEEVRGMKRRLGIAEEALRIKKERLEDAVQEYDEDI